MLRALCPLDGRDLPFETNWRGIKYQGNLNNVIDYATFFYGAYAKSELALLERIAHFLNSRGIRFTFLDVGTNVGTHALFMARYSQRVVGFEPVEEVRLRALNNVQLNQLDNVEILGCALGERSGDAEIYCSESFNMACNSLVPEFVPDNSTTGRRINVKRGDELVSALNLHNIKVVKIDVEGFEAQVCEGLKNTLIRERPFILMELWKFNLRYFDKGLPFPNCIYPHSAAYELIGTNNGRYKLAPYDLRDHPGSGQAEIVIVPDELKSFLADNSFCKYLP